MDWLMKRAERLYARVLKVTLRRPLVTVILTLLVFSPTIYVIKTLPSEMTPKQDQSAFMVRMKTAVDSSLDFTDSRVKVAEDYLRKMPEVAGLYSSIGGGDVVNEAQIFVTLVDKKDRRRSQQEIIMGIRKDLAKQLKGVKVNISDNSFRGLSSGRGFPVELSIDGPDWTMLGKLVAEMMQKMEDSGVMTDVNTDFEASMPEISIRPNRERALAHGVEPKEIATTVNALLGGTILGAASKYPKEGHKYDINVRLEGDERSREEDIGKIQVRNNFGQLVPLREVVTLEHKNTPQEIRRIDRQRAILIFADVEKGYSQADALATVERLGKEILPRGYTVRLRGSAQTFRETFKSLGIAMLLGIFVAYMVLASQFNSFVHPLSVLMALPFSICGAYLALAVTHQTLNMFSIIGLILLMGIVKKNSILLVDFTGQQRAAGKELKEALLYACPIRLRPILMTSVATVVGALPTALALGPGSEMRVPMAIAIIGGVLLSTLLTLIAVPSVYAVLAQFESKR